MIGEVRLDTVEIMIGSLVGSMRRCHNIKKGNPMTENFGLATNASWQTDIDAAHAEMALANLTNSYWGGAFFYKDKKQKDVGVWHVRSTRHQDGCLILRPKDKDKIAELDRVVLVVVATPIFRVAGSIVFGAVTGDDSPYWRTDQPGREGRGGGAWWIPQSDLEPTL